MRAGRLDRRVQVQTRTVARGPTGEAIEQWSAPRERWAEVVLVSASERRQSEQVMATRTATFRLRWERDLVGAQSRLVYDGFIWDVRGVKELGRREGLELMAEAEAGREAVR